MSDTGELGGPTPEDPAERAGIGAGLEPGDLSDGELQEEALEQERDTWGDGPTDDDPPADT